MEEYGVLTKLRVFYMNATTVSILFFRTATVVCKANKSAFLSSFMYPLCGYRYNIYVEMICSSAQHFWSCTQLQINLPFPPLSVLHRNILEYAAGYIAFYHRWCGSATFLIFYPNLKLNKKEFEDFLNKIPTAGVPYFYVVKELRRFLQISQCCRSALVSTRSRLWQLKVAKFYSGKKFDCFYGVLAI